MESSHEEVIRLVSGTVIPPHKKRLAVHLILASTLFERIAFYIISVNLVPTLESTTSFNWSTTNSSATMLIFSGK